MYFQGINWHYSTLAWIIPFSVSARKVCVPAQLPQLCLTLCDPMGGSQPGSLSMGFSRQEYWSGLPCPPQGRSSCVQFSQYFLVKWSLYILFFSEGYFQIFFGNFLFQHLEYIIPLSPGPLGFCWEIFLDPNEGSLVNSRSVSNS